MPSHGCKGTKTPESGKIEVMAPNSGAGQDFKGADEQKRAQPNKLHRVQLSHSTPYLGMSGLPCNIGQHQKTPSWSGLKLREIHLCRHLGPAPISEHIHLSALPLVLFPWRQWVLLDLALTSFPGKQTPLHKPTECLAEHAVSSVYSPTAHAAIPSQCWASLKLWSWLQLLGIIYSTKRGSSVALLPQHGRAAYH